MIQEIVTTYTDKGIVKESSGYCPVAFTQGMAIEDVKRLGEIARRQIEHLQQTAIHEFGCHFPIKLQGKHTHLLTRGFRVPGKDSKPGHFVVHQILVNQITNKPGGPASMLANDGFWITRWNAKKQLLKPRNIESSPLSPRICEAWQDATGDAGWASAPIEAWEKNKTSLLLTNQNLTTRDITKLLMESQSLLPAEDRWKIPICVNAWHPFKTTSGFWIAVDKASQQAIDAMSDEQVERIDLTGRLPTASGKFSGQARAGAWINFNSGSSSNMPPKK
ncbi:MAG: hypothetical protein R3C03_08080 [Pirellulaceae bacterium]